MTMSVRFCFSYDLLKWDFIASNDHFNKKNIVDMDIVSDVTCTRQRISTLVVIRLL